MVWKSLSASAASAILTLTETTEDFTRSTTSANEAGPAEGCCVSATAKLGAKAPVSTTTAPIATAATAPSSAARSWRTGAEGEGARDMSGSMRWVAAPGSFRRLAADNRFGRLTPRMAPA